MWALERPAYLFLLLLVPLGIYFRHFWKRRGGRIAFSYAVWKGTSFKPSQRMLYFVLGVASLAFWSGVVLLIVALAGPSRVTRERIYLNHGMDIMFVLDESPSMAAEDFQPVNRFESAKQVIRQFVHGRENDAIGLVSFSKEAALRVPPTLDRAVFLKRLDQLHLMSLGDGTAIGMGLAVAALHLEKSTAQRRIIILITDGENNAGEITPEAAAAIASQMGIRIYTIGIGTQGDVPIEYTDPTTGKVVKGMFASRFNEDLLKKIAAAADGRYFFAKSPGALNAVFRTIDSVEPTDKRVKIKTKADPRYPVFVLVGVGLVLFEFLVRKGMLREVL